MKKVGKVVVVVTGCREGEVRYLVSFGRAKLVLWQISVLLQKQGKESRTYVE